MLGARQGLSQELGTVREMEHCRVICLGGCKTTSHLQANRFPPATKISPCWKDADPMTLPGTVCTRRYWDLRLSLCSLALQLTARKRNNQKTQKCLLVGSRKKGEYKIRRFTLWTGAAPSVGAKYTHSLDTVSWDIGPWLGTHGMGGEVEFPSLS